MEFTYFEQYWKQVNSKAKGFEHPCPPYNCNVLCLF